MLAVIEALYRLFTTVNLRRFLIERDYRRAAIQEDPLRATLAVLGQVLALSVLLAVAAIVCLWLWNRLGGD